MRVKFLFAIVILVSTSAFSQQQTFYKDPTTALENFDFKSIDFATLDTVSRDYIQAVEHSLYHRFDKAEVLLKKVALQSTSTLSGPARFYLLNELYFWRGKYADYVQFADQLNEEPEFYEMAKQLADCPTNQVDFLTDSLRIPITIQKHSYIIATVLLNGKPARLILDSGASATIISQRLFDQLQITILTQTDLLNSVGTTFTASAGILNSLSIGNVTSRNMPIFSSQTSQFFKRLHVDGLLGWDVLRKFSYTADFNHQTLLIQKPVPDSTRERNLLGIRQPLLILRSMAGNQLNMFFDSGSNSIDLTARGATKLGAYKTGLKPGMAAGIGKTRIGLLRYVKNFTFQLGGKSFHRKRTYLSPVEWINLSVKCDGVISNAPFQKGRLTVDYLNNHFHYSE